MIRSKKLFIIGVILIGVVSIGIASVRNNFTLEQFDPLALLLYQDVDTTDVSDKLPDGTLRFPIKDKSNNPNLEKYEQGGLDLDDPSNIEYRSEYDPNTNQVTLYRKVGGVDMRLPYTMSLQEYMNDDMRKSMGKYYRDKIQNDAGNSTPGTANNWLGSAWRVGGDGFENVFGSNAISIKSQGSAEIIIGVKHSKIDNPALQEDLRKTTTFDFDQKIQVNVQAAIGDKLKMGINYNTEASFDFENQTKLEYAGKEDDIIRKIEFGNVTMPLPGSLITGSQSLFGVKAELQFGKLNVVTLFSQQKGQTKVLNIEGGAQQQEFEVAASAYDKNRHFFLALEFRDNFESALKNIPEIVSQYKITDLEVWVTNKTGNYDNARNIIAFTDLAETTFSSTNLWTVGTDTLPGNDANNLYYEMDKGLYKNARDITKTSEEFAKSSLKDKGFALVKDYEKIENARKLAPTEYKYNDVLGYLSLNTALNNDEVLAVYYTYTYNGKTYTVGDKATSGVEGSKALYLKMLKATNLSPDYITTWKLMMKNIYSLGAFQISKDDFRLDISILNDTAGGFLNYLPEGNADVIKKRFLSLMDLDKLNQQGDQQVGGDGMFDFVEGITINSSNGRVVFPVLEPFGSHLKTLIADPAISDKYVYQEIYDKTITDSKEQANKDKFRLKGKYKSSGGSDISLNAMDIPEGGVTITAGGIVLKENVDYTVDYALGRVKIINKGLLESGTPIQISLESRALFNLQTKTMMGMHLDYKFNPKFNLGATIMNLSEQPLTTKVNIGSEPINNTIWGLNGTYVTDSKALTNFLNKAPFWNLKEPSSLSVDGEFAQLIPGHNKAIGKEGTSYIDDFEGSVSSIDLRSWTSWHVASTPQGQEGLPGQTNLFPEGKDRNALTFNKNRARLAWYVIDPLFYNKSGVRPSYMNDETISDDRIRQVQVSELYPNRNTAYGQPTNVAVFNLAYYPSERGQYNYDSNVDPSGNLLLPEERWAGVMRSIETNDFEAANIEYIEFWMMDPSFNDPSYTGGDFYINLGNVSEDVLSDGRKSFEHGMPVPGVNSNVDQTVWGNVPEQQALTNAFSTDPQSLLKQDIGLDGLSSANEDEKNFFEPFLNSLPADARIKAVNDPSSDNFQYFRDTDFDNQQATILERYKKYNNPEGNSVPSDYSGESYATASTSIPDQEDVNKDNTLSESESYFQYQISLNKDSFVIGKNYITDVLPSTVTLPNGKKSTATWYQFRVPVTDSRARAVNGIKDLRSVRFMRLFLKNCQDTTILRFGSMDLVRGDWRRYSQDLRDDKAVKNSATFDLSAVNIEENGNRTPINYVLPPGVDRVQNPSNPQVQLLNEQALVMRVNDLVEGDARGAYKSMQMDIRQYKYLKMFVHAEAKEVGQVNDDDLAAFIRIGSDFSDNYYEYEVPLKITPWGSTSAEEIWPASNEINLKMENLEAIKLARNDLKRAGQGGGEFTKRFVRSDPDNENNQIIILGNPSISNVKSIMVGVRNRRKTGNHDNKSAEVWFNELRLTNFDEQGGWAANARMTLKLSEFGTLALAGATSTIGFGSLDKSVSERNQADNIQYDFATTLELGKLLGPSSRMSIPFYSSTSKAISTPKYYPVDPDIKLETALNQVNTKAEKDEIKSVSQDLTTRKSINFTNVKLMPKSDQVPVYDVSNLAATYSYNETYKQNVSTTFLEDKNYRGVLGYNYNARPKAFEPFVKSESLNNSAFKLIRDFNIYPYPNQVSYSWEITRNYREEQFRNLSEPNEIIPLVIKKDFYWNRFFDLKYSITKNLKFDFRAITNARIDEPIGVVNSNDPGYSAWSDSVISSIKHMGRKTSYQHNFNFNYTIPINKLPYLDWTSASLRYGGMYNWMLAPITTSSAIDMGNTIKNSNTIQLTGQLNLTTLYNKSNYIKSLWKKYDFDAPKKEKNSASENARFNKNGLAFEKGKPLTIDHKLKTTEVTLRAFDKSGKPLSGKTEVSGPNSVIFTPDSDAAEGRVMVTGQVNSSSSPLQTVLDVSTLIITSVKNISASYSENNGSILPGYQPSSGFMGMSSSAPGIPFIMGWQDDAFDQKASANNWTTKDPNFNRAYTMVKSRDFSIKSNIEPFKGFKIELISDRRETYSLSELYRNDSINGFIPKGRTETGTFSMSFIALGTFKKVETTGSMNSEGYNQFLANRSVISHRLAGTSPSPSDTSSYANGYGALQQDVLISAFTSAYSGISPNKIFLSSIPSFAAMMPNWRISYDGIGKIGGVKKVAKSVDLLHAYRCTYNVGSYVSSSSAGSIDRTGNIVPVNQIGTVSINEQFSPLIMVNVSWANDITTRAEFKKGRTLSLNLTNSQLIENYNNEMIFGVGYRFDKLGIILNNKKLTNDINLRVDFSIRENQAIIRKIQEQVNQLTAGMRTSAFIFTADYALNSRYNLQAFFRRNVNTPFISLSFPTTDASYGISFRMSLSQ